MAQAVSDEAWLQAMLDVEAALARAQAAVGVVPRAAAEAIAAACGASRFDVARIGQEARRSANPVPALVRQLTSALPAEAAAWVHWGATSQDILDSAMMLVARRGLDLITADLAGLAAACAGLAERHRATLMPGRTLLQQALPITFGLKAAGWLVAVDEARVRLVEVRRQRLAVQLGGAAGTLAALGERGLEVAAALARELRLAEPVLPWHTARARVAELGAALAVAAGVAGKIALDVVLLAQTEVAEVSEGSPGGSSTLPQKRNPAAAVEVRAAARSAVAPAGLLLGLMDHEQERAAGSWQAEWPALTEVLLLTSGATGRAGEMLEQLVVDEERMLANLAQSGEPLMAESVTMSLAARVGRARALELVGTSLQRVQSSRTSLREELLTDPGITGHLSAAEIAEALEPAAYLGSTSKMIDRALAAHAQRSDPR
jgi:3-carboxy-cis,cis-muconate cycloisomerase